MKKFKCLFLLPLFAILFFTSCQTEEISEPEKNLDSKISTQIMLKDFFQVEGKAVEAIEFRLFCQGTDSSIWFSPETGEYGLVSNTGVKEITRTEAQSWCQNNGVVNP